MSVKSAARARVRRAVVWYSIRNRQAKARRISGWMTDHGCRTVLFVGAVGAESTDANTGIVEDAVAEGREVRMGINVTPAVTDYPFTVADARDMPFEDDYVDFALANAVIEHVGDREDQLLMVKEMTRVARCWVITTPNKWFPIESHTSTLLWHWSPRWRARRPEFTRLLSRREFAALLPEGATIVGRPWSPTFSAYYAGETGQTHARS